jgi:hypothetical protein
MAKQEKVKPPEITEQLLREAADIFLEAQEYESTNRTIYNKKDTKSKFADVGAALNSLLSSWDKLSEQEREWFFMFVNPIADGRAELLLGQPTKQSPYGKCYEDNVHNTARARIAEACKAYSMYERFASLSGRPEAYAQTTLVRFFVLHWERATGKPAVYVRDPAGGGPVGLAKSVAECLMQMQSMGVKDVEVAHAENRVEKVYKELRKERLSKKRGNTHLIG